MNEDEKLKPCPFCGSRDKLECVENRESDFSMRIVCRNCDSFHTDRHACRIAGFPIHALRAWNTRASQPAPPCDAAREIMEAMEAATQDQLGGAVDREKAISILQSALTARAEEVRSRCDTAIQTALARREPSDGAWADACRVTVEALDALDLTEAGDG